ncbi:4-alpha-glucanotransferase [Spirabiliibacterium mucosae]|uniref:4-alpha-glucanotransferase n=1 Tax=Spirabiliibacterium mucosae TaxID=28156 RepID=UPI0031F36A75
MAKQQALNKKRLAQLGIIPSFYDGRGLKQKPNPLVVKSILHCLGAAVKNTLLPSTVVFYAEQPKYVRLAAHHGALHGHWQLTLEDGQTLHGRVKKSGIMLPRDLALGYHQLSIKCGRQAGLCRVIVAPQRCYQAPALSRQKHLWGTSLQLYTLKSERNWGVGDFTDLLAFMASFARHGGDFVGLNPTHALFPAFPDAASPYSPSSRQWLNIIYIDVAAIPEFADSAAAMAWLNAPDTQAKLAAVRATDWVDYPSVMALKLHGLRLAFDAFNASASDARQGQYRTFVTQGGESLRAQATLDVMLAHFAPATNHGWQSLPAEFQDFTSSATAQWIAGHQSAVDFYAWVQWVAAEQLAQCQRQSTMALGLYRDLAVGVSPVGAETWHNPQAYSLNATIGAPPDALAPQGQNWCLAPFNPHALAAQGFQPFIDMLRANMRDCAALRLDHIMSLLRLWWIKQGEGAVNGVYVRYPVDTLLAILALESQRHQCMIIGEDLGTVPKAIQSKLQRAGVFSYKVQYFEFDVQGQSRALGDYPYQAMATLSTHDLPTIYGYWTGSDITIGQQFGVFPSEQVLKRVQFERRYAKEKILARLREAGVAIPEEVSAELNSPCPHAFVYALQRYMSGVNSALLTLQVEDWLVMEKPVNIPGTDKEYPNWRRKLSRTIGEIFADTQVQTLLEAISTARREKCG